MLVIPDVAGRDLLDLLAGVLEARIHLYQTDTPLDRGTVLADLVEVSAVSYEPIAIPTWQDAVTEAGRAVITAEPVQWEPDDDDEVQQVWGYFVTHTPTGALLWVERGPAPPYVWGPGAEPIRVVPTFTLRDQLSLVAVGV